MTHSAACHRRILFPRSVGLNRDKFSDNNSADLQAGRASTKNLNFLKLTSV